MEDQKIVQMYWERKEQAILSTSEKYDSYCMAIAENILGNREDAKECVNDALLVLWNKIPPDKPQMLSTYLGKIVRNLSINRYKKNKRKKRGGGQLPLVLEELEEVLSGSKGLEEEWEESYLLECINAFLTELPEEKRKLFVCRYWYADSVKDIAQRFDMTPNHVSVTLKRIRKKLHDYLIERGYEL